MSQRLIDADALKEYIDCGHLRNPRELCFSEIDVVELIDAQPTIDAVPQWIPCSERLPEDVAIGEEYPTVIFCTKDTVYAGFFEHYLGGKWWAAEDFTVDGVIAWMPLPKPYEVKE